jgi:hypothetical protein
MSSRVGCPLAQASTDGINPIVISTSGQNAFQLLDGSYGAVATFYSVPLPVATIDSYSLEVVIPATGAPVGSLTLQRTNDIVVNVNQKPTAYDLLAANWQPLFFSVNGAAFASAFAVPAGGTTIILDENRCNYEWVRMVVTYTSGTISPYARWCLKGNLGR